MDEKVIVVAFDGMDKELIESYQISTFIDAKEFGTLDNSKGIHKRMTSELFASFITGKTWKEHGIKGLKKPSSQFQWWLRENLIPRYLIEHVRGFTKLQNALIKVLNTEGRKQDKSDLETDTLFDKIGTSKALFVPSYNPDPFWKGGFPHEAFKGGKKVTRKAAKRMNCYRLNEFYNLNHELWDFVMLHLHDPDGLQDIGIRELERDYRRLGYIAEEILDQFEETHTVIFLSDHGLPEGEEHNKNAFYSCNRELFPEKTPHITDFHDKILEILDQESS